MLSVVLNIITIAIVILFYVLYGTPKEFKCPSETAPWYWTASDAFDANNTELLATRNKYIL